MAPPVMGLRFTSEPSGQGLFVTPMLPLARPPRNVCILRLSAIGDTCHVVPVLRTLQQAWPTTQFTWVIGKAEARLMSLIEGVEFITVDKRAGLFGARRQLRAQLAGRRFDVLLHMQLALRASLLAQAIDADIKLGFDRARARELQWLFTNAQIAARVARARAGQILRLCRGPRRARAAGALGHPAAARGARVCAAAHSG